MFEKLGRGHDEGAVPGSGIGLDLSGRIIHRHGTGLRLESTREE